MAETLEEAIKRARDLIVRAADQEKVDRKIVEITALSHDEQKKELHALYLSAQQHAAEGNAAYIALIELVSEHFHVDPHTRMLLHYYAQAEANKGKLLIHKDITREKQGKIRETFAHISDVLEILSNIATAFTEADTINTITGK